MGSALKPKLEKLYQAVQTVRSRPMNVCTLLVYINLFYENKRSRKKYIDLFEFFTRDDFSVVAQDEVQETDHETLQRDIKKYSRQLWKIDQLKRDVEAGEKLL